MSLRELVEYSRLAFYNLTYNSRLLRGKLIKEIMTNKKQKKFSKVAAVKSNARERVGNPKASFVITPKTKRNPRYKENWLNVLENNNANQRPQINDLGDF